MSRLAGAFIRSASMTLVPAPYNYGAHRSCEDYRPLCRRLATQNVALLAENKRTICPSRPDAVLSNEAVARQRPRGGPRRLDMADARTTARAAPFDAAGGPPGRDPEGGAVAPTGCVAPLARWICIARRGVPALPARPRRADRGQCEKCGLTFAERAVQLIRPPDASRQHVLKAYQ